MIKLIRRNGPFIPGGYPYVDPRTNMRFDGMEADFSEQVQKIIRHRTANPKIYPPAEGKFLSTEFVADELDVYQCQRFGNDPKYCSDGKPFVGTVGRVSERKCSICGGPLVERLCPTCSGSRVIGYTCNNCKKDFPI